MFELKIIKHFSAAHQLKIASKKCENLHGHNWKIEVCVAGETLEESGILMDFGEVKAHLSKIIAKLDHRFLNELDYFHGSPSSENIALYIAKNLQASIDNSSVKVVSVSAWESNNSCATYKC